MLPAGTGRLLDVSLAARTFDLLFDLLGLVFLDAFLDRLGRALDEFLGLLEAKPRDGRWWRGTIEHELQLRRSRGDEIASQSLSQARAWVPAIAMFAALPFSFSNASRETSVSLVAAASW